MSLFGSIARGIGRAIGGAIEKVGEKTGLTILENAGRSLKDVCSETSRKVSETREYDKQSASVNQTVNMSEILSSFSIGLEAQADTIERSCILESQRYFDDLIKTLEATKSVIRTNRLKSSLNSIEKSINGSLKKHLAKRVSLDDVECSQILQMTSGKEKEKAMNNFGKKVIKEALENLSNQIENIVKEQNEEIQEFLEDILEKQEKELSTMQNQFNSIFAQSENDMINKENAKLTPLILIDATDIVFSKLSE